MSVINKMLRDLDQRQAALGTPAMAGVPPAGMGASGLPGTTGPVHARRWWVWAAVAAVALGAAGTAGLLLLPEPPAQPSIVAAVPASGIASAAPAQTPVSVTAVAPIPSTVASAGAPSGDGETVLLRMEAQLSAQKALDALLTTPPPPPLPPKVATSGPGAVASSVSDAAPPKSRLAARPAPTPADTDRIAAFAPRSGAAPTSTNAGTQGSAGAVARRSPLAGSEALAQAQALWNSGSADAAIDTLSVALTDAERSVRSGAEGVGNPQLLTLVREWTRMQLASGRYGAVWELLTRMEPVLGPVADLWALRANAAQRIGRHQDSVHAYMTALQLRPDEQRWMLGAAVSLAALGQSASASELIEKARALGPINKSIAAYLRQSGVSLPE